MTGKREVRGRKLHRGDARRCGQCMGQIHRGLRLVVQVLLKRRNRVCRGSVGRRELVEEHERDQRQTAGGEDRRICKSTVGQIGRRARQ